MLLDKNTDLVGMAIEVYKESRPVPGAFSEGWERALTREDVQRQQGLTFKEDTGTLLMDYVNCRRCKCWVTNWSFNDREYDEVHGVGASQRLLARIGKKPASQHQGKTLQPSDCAENQNSPTSAVPAHSGDSESTVSPGIPTARQESVAKTAEKPISPNVEYFEVLQPSGDGICSDNDCPCGVPGARILNGSGYLYVSPAAVAFRRIARSIVAAQIELTRLGKTPGTFDPSQTTAILMCEQGARKRGLDLAVAAADARHWWKTGQAPLRATPLATPSIPLPSLSQQSVGSVPTTIPMAQAVRINPLSPAKDKNSNQGCKIVGLLSILMGLVGFACGGISLLMTLFVASAPPDQVPQSSTGNYLADGLIYLVTPMILVGILFGTVGLMILWGPSLLRKWTNVVDHAFPASTSSLENLLHLLRNQLQVTTIVLAGGCLLWTIFLTVAPLLSSSPKALDLSFMVCLSAPPWVLVLFVIGVLTKPYLDLKRAASNNQWPDLINLLTGNIPGGDRRSVLLSLRDPEAINAMVDATASALNEELTQRPSSAREQRKKLLLDVLSKTEASVTRPLLTALQEQRLSLQMVAHLLSGKDASLDVDAWLSLVNSSNLQIRLFAIEKLAGCQDPRVVPILIPLLKDSDPVLRLVATSTLRAGRNPFEETLPALDLKTLLESLQGQVAIARKEAARELGKLIESNERVVKALVVAAENDEDPLVRRVAADALKSEAHREILRQLPDLAERDQFARVKSNESSSAKLPQLPNLDATEDRSHQSTVRVPMFIRIVAFIIGTLAVAFVSALFGGHGNTITVADLVRGLAFGGPGAWGLVEIFYKRDASTPSEVRPVAESISVQDQPATNTVSHLPATQPVPELTQTDAPSFYCQQCRKQPASRMSFGWFCSSQCQEDYGRQLYRNSGTKFCQKCGTSLDITTLFCQECEIPQENYR